MMPPSPVQFLNKIVPDAFHGSKLDTARQIVRTKAYVPSSGNENLYLGDGVYFYEGSLEYAVEWAQDKFAGHPIGVVQSTIQLGKCLDLNTRKAVELIVWVREQFRTKLPDQLVRDASVLNWLAKYQKVDTIRATFPNSSSKQKIFSGSHFFRSQLVICVINQDCIKKHVLVFNGQGDAHAC